MLVLLDMITLAYDSAYMSRDKKNRCMSRELLSHMINWTGLSV